MAPRGTLARGFPVRGSPAQRPELRLLFSRGACCMSESRANGAVRRDGCGGLPDACRWVADAHAAGDSEQLAIALSCLYRLLDSRGWVLPDRPSTLLRVHEAAVDAALARLVERHYPPS